MDIKDFYSFGSKLLSNSFQARPENVSSDQLNKLAVGNIDDLEKPVIFKHE